MFCAKCGARIDDNARFCDKCGSSVLTPQGSGQKAGPVSGGNVAGQGKEASKKKGFLAVLAAALVLIAVAVGVSAVRKDGGGTALCAGGFESAVKEAVNDIAAQYAASVAGEGQADGQGMEENENTTASETVFAQYSQFLQGNLTAECEGNQVTFQQFYENYCKAFEVDEGDGEYQSYPPKVTFALTDIDMNKLPELHICKMGDQAAGDGWSLYTLYSENSELKIAESATGGWSDYFTLYTNGLLWLLHGQHEPRVEWFDTLQGEKIACFVEYSNPGDMEYAENERRQWMEEGYKQVYVTYSGDTSGTEYTPSSFAAEYGGEEVQFYSLEEISSMLPVPDTSTESAAEDTKSPWLIRMKNCTIDVDLSAYIPAEYLKAAQRDTYGDALQRVVSSYYTHPEMLTITQASFVEYDPSVWFISYPIENSDCVFQFSSNDGGGSWKYDYLVNAHGSDYGGFAIIFDNGVPGNISSLYDNCIETEGLPENFRDEKIYRTDYIMGDFNMNLRDGMGNSYEIPVQELP